MAKAKKKATKLVYVGVNENDNKKYKFHRNDMLSFGLLAKYEKDLQEVATILACNVEQPMVDDSGIVDITSSNFNDSFEDMIGQLTGQDLDDEDDDE